VKHHLKAKYYLRYSDDFVLLHEEKEKLRGWRGEIREFLQSRLRLELNESRQTVGPISNGADFLGYIVRPHYLLVRRRVVNRLKARLFGYEKKLVRWREGCTVFRFDHSTLEKLRATWSSYMAHMKVADTYRLREKLLGRFAWLRRFFEQDRGRLKWRGEAPASLYNLKRQYWFFLRKCRGSILFFQVGRFFEFYDEQAERVLEVLGLRRIEARRGFGIRCGFPVNLKEKYLKKLMGLGFSVYVVREGEGWLSGVKQRVVGEAWIVAPGAATRKGVFDA